MKKIDTLNQKLLKPRRQTISFLMSYSSSIDVLKTKSTTLIVHKN